MHVEPTRQIPFTVAFAGYFQLTVPGYRGCTWHSNRRSDAYSMQLRQLRGNHVLAVLHTLSHKDRGEEKTKKRGWKAIGENRERNVTGSHPSENPKK